MNQDCRIIKCAALACAIAASALPGVASADESEWAVRLGVTQLTPANKSDSFTALNLNFPADAVHVSKKTLPEFDIFYSFSPNIVAELVLTVPQRHTVTLGGPTQGAELGYFKELPPTLLAQYHFLPGTQFDPYAGAGLNFTWINPVHLSVAGTTLDLKKSSFGPAVQLGVDSNIDKTWFVNLDFKYILLRTDVSAGGTKLTTARVDPTLVSLGVGYRF